MDQPEDDPFKPPIRQSFRTAALFADVSGFTKLSESLAKRGPVGAEMLGFYLNRYLERLVKFIARSGGDVFKFAGDAMIVLWPPPPGGKKVTDKQLKEMVHRATQCCLDIQEELKDVQLAENLVLSVKLGVGVGEGQILHVGGVYGRLEYLFTGPCLTQAFRCEGSAVAGDTIISASAYEMVKEDFVGTVCPDTECFKITECKRKIRNISLRHERQGNDDQDMMRLRKYIPAAVLPHLAIDQKLWAGQLRQVSIIFCSLGFKASKLNNITKETLDEVQKVVATLQSAVYEFEGSLNKFLIDDKGSTVVIVSGLPPLAHEDDPVRAVLTCLRIRSLVNEMGYSCSFGVTSGLALCGLIGSGTRREYTVLGDVVNLSARLMQAAKGGMFYCRLFSFHFVLDVFCVSCVVVVLSGYQMSCFKISSIFSFLFPISAHAQLLSLPFLSPPSPPYFLPGILVDRATCKGADSSPYLSFKKLPPIKVKGKSQLIPVYEPVAQKPRFGEHIPNTYLYTVGRKDIICRMQEGVDVMLETGEGSIFMLKGEVGRGKSHILRYLTSEYLQNPITNVIWAKGDSLSMKKKHYLWQQLVCPLVLGDLYEEEGSEEMEGGEDSSPEELEAHRAERSKELHSYLEDFICEKEPSLLPFMSCVNHIMRTDFPTTSLSKELSASQFAQKTLDITCAFLKEILEHTSVVLCFDQAQWMSPEDWTTLAGLCRMVNTGQLRNISIWIGIVPLENKKYAPKFSAAPPSYFKVQDLSEVIEVHAFRKDETLEILAQHFGVRSVDPELLKIIHERSGGVPLFIQKFISTLLMKQAIVIEDHAVTFTDMWADRVTADVELTIPYRVQRIAASHLDNLDPQHMMVLNVAAVLCIGKATGCNEFAVSILKAAHPINDHKKNVDSVLGVLEKYGFLAPIDNDVPENNNRASRSFVRVDSSSPLAMLTSGSTQAKPAQRYRFTYGFLRDMVYQLMLYKQRKRIHDLAATYLQSQLEMFLSDEDISSDIHARHAFLGNEHADHPDIDWEDNLRVTPQRLKKTTKEKNVLFKSVRKRQMSRFNIVPIKKESTLKAKLARIFCCASGKKKERVVETNKRHMQPIVVEAVNDNHTGPPVRGTADPEIDMVESVNKFDDMLQFYRERRPSEWSLLSEENSPGGRGMLLRPLSTASRPMSANSDGHHLSQPLPHGLSLSTPNSPMARHSGPNSGSNTPNSLDVRRSKHSRSQSSFGPRSPRRKVSLLREVTCDLTLLPESHHHRSASANIPGTYRGDDGTDFFVPLPPGSTIITEEDELDMSPIGGEDDYGDEDGNEIGPIKVVRTPPAPKRNVGAHTTDDESKEEEEKEDHLIQVLQSVHPPTTLPPLNGPRSGSSSRSPCTNRVGSSPKLSPISVCTTGSSASGGDSVEGPRDSCDSFVEDMKEKVKLMCDKNETPDESPSTILHGVDADTLKEVCTIGSPVPTHFTVQQIAVRELLESLDRWDFDIFSLSEETVGNPLLYIGYAIAHKYNIMSQFSISPDTLITFLTGIEHGYNKPQNAYHNSTHAADVLQTSFLLYKALIVNGSVAPIDTLSLFVATIIHDYRHPGVTNQFLVSTNDERALLFNDTRVLENFHCTSAFQFLRNEKNDILSSLSPQTKQIVRKKVIGLVLATNLVDQQEFLDEIATKLSIVESLERFMSLSRTTIEAGAPLSFSEEENSNIIAPISGSASFDPTQHSDLITKLVIKCGDISNAAKPAALYNRWADNIISEFYIQGDKERERGMRVSRFMDRKHPEEKADCQLMFIESIVLPTYVVLASILPSTRDICLSHVYANRNKWSSEKDTAISISRTSTGRVFSPKTIPETGVFIPSSCN